MLSVLFCSSQVYGEEAPLKSLKEKASYSIGLNIGNNMKNQSADIDPETFAIGFKDAFFGKEPRLSDTERQNALNQFQKEMMAKAEEKHKDLSAKNQKESEKFLAENKKKKGVVTLPSGLQYKVISKGKGEKPKLTDKVTTHYRGTLIDGTEFDSSFSRGEPATFPVNGVIAGWTEALQLMEVGSKWKLFVPASLAYGDRGAGQKIGPNATLIFDVELISIQE
jgi:FKBP-type peptidyl-prolyl cis-trans isomerase FklB